MPRLPARRPLLCLLAILLSVERASAADWPQFRGLRGGAASTDTGLPESWSATENVVWKTELPGFGASSPVTAGERIFLTCYSGYGLDANSPGKEEDLQRHLLCFDRTSGSLLWQRHVPAAQPEASYVDFMPMHGYASSTPCSDGDRVYASFGKSGMRAYDLQGALLWQAETGATAHYWGSGGSPTTLGGLLLVNAAVESQSLFAFDKLTGKEVWRVKGLLSSWSTPLTVDLPSGGQEVVLSVKGRLVAVDPQTGEQQWTVKTNQAYAAPTPVFHGGLVLAYNGRPNRLLAVRPGGQGDVSETSLAWKAEGVGAGITSPVAFGEYVYCVDDRGLASCVRVATGEIVYQKRLSGEGLSFYASPVAVDGKVFAFSRQQGAFVFAAGPAFRLLARNSLAPDDSLFNATPAVSNGQLLVRSNRHLYCLGRTGK